MPNDMQLVLDCQTKRAKQQGPCAGRGAHQSMIRPTNGEMRAAPASAHAAACTCTCGEDAAVSTAVHSVYHGSLQRRVIAEVRFLCVPLQVVAVMHRMEHRSFDAGS